MTKAGLDSAWLAALALPILGSWTSPASALELTFDAREPSIVGEDHTFEVSVTDAAGEVTFQWRFGDVQGFEEAGAAISHTFAEPGHHAVDVSAVDQNGDTASAFFLHLAHYPLSARRPTSATSIVHDAARNRIYSLNQDNGTLTSIDPEALVKVAELPVYATPESLTLAPDGKLWVLHRDDYAIAIVDPDAFVIERGFRLPYASQPIGIAMSPTGDAAYVTLMALGKLLKLDPVTGSVVGELDVGPTPRGLAVSEDGSVVYITRFLSPDSGGEVVRVDAATLTVRTRIPLRLDAETEDSDLQARGLPNYLFAIGLTPDGRQAWIPGKKDNVVRGLFRDGQSLTHDTTVRPLTSILDLQADAELYESRLDLDDRSMPFHVEFSPFGDFAILTLAGSNRVEIRDVYRPNQVFSAIADTGVFPRATVLTPGGRLFVQGALSRNVLAYDLSVLLQDFDAGSPPLLADIPAVANEKLAPDVLQGKQLFHTAADTRVAFEGYLSCGGCHFEGIDDGRVWDFTDRGEGLRNTAALLGRKGTAHGPLNWTGTLDEVQDFEHLIRDFFDGTGLLPDEVFNEGTRNQPLGDSKAGLSPELDALAAYVSSLDRVNPSPHRNLDGTLTADGEAGRGLYERLGCDFCHGGSEFTNSGAEEMPDVGTLTPASGSRAGETLFGVDTPTLLGVWETPPYLHDGSAPTLRDVLTTKNPDGLHGYVSVLSPTELDQLLAYVSQIDDALPVRRLPFEPPTEDGGPSSPAAGSGSVGGATGAGGAETGVSAGAEAVAGEAGSPAQGGGGGGVMGPAGADAVAPTMSRPGASGCACRTVSTSPVRVLSLGPILIGLLLAAAARQRRRRSRAWLGGILTLLGLGGCGPAPESSGPMGEGGGAAEPPNVAGSPAVTPLDPELEPLGTGLETYQRVCARGRGDVVARALCEPGIPPAIGSLTELLALVGLGDSTERAFALTGNSTSLVARAVSAINPRMIVFPRVQADLAAPPALTAVGFVRGEPFVELVSRDPATADLNFYLLGFERSCNHDVAGCDLASLLTEELERGWTGYSIYDQDDLEGTSLDCLSCHAPGPYGSRRILRMQELDSPWLHWFPQRFGQRTESDRELVAQFAEAHDQETQYGGVPLPTILNALDEGSGAQLEALVRAEGDGDQPNAFDAQIAAEARAGESPTWEARFGAHLSGAAIAVPYPGIDVTDPTKRAALVRAYHDVLVGVAPRESLPDLRDVFSDDAKVRLSFVPWPMADGRTVIQQMCARCHDGRGNPALEKNRFDVTRLDEMPRELKSQAIARLTATGVTKMPPARTGALTPEALALAIAELEK